MNTQKSIYVISGTRTPFLKARGAPGPFSAADLAVSTCQALLDRQPFSPQDLGEVIAGCVMPSEKEANIARIISLRLGCGNHVPAWTVQRNCASGLQALDCAMKDILLGQYDLVLAGGVESMSHAPVLWPRDGVQWLSRYRHAKTLQARLSLLAQFRTAFLKPVLGLLGGLTDPIVGLSMGETAEVLATDYSIARTAMDEFALQSHERCVTASKKGYFSEITPLFDTQGNSYVTDEGIRPDTSLEQLAQLPPFFDKPYGSVTAGNSSQISDGASFLILASQNAVEKYQLPVLGKIIDVRWAGVDPRRMGLGPVYAMLPLLKKHELRASDIDYWEINEAFAAQVLACLQVFNTEGFGTLLQERLNIDGGAIALGHPVGASGARIVLHLLHILNRTGSKRGIASLCIGGGQGGAVLVEV